MRTRYSIAFRILYCSNAFMKTVVSTISLLVLLVFTGCKSIGTLSARDQSLAKPLKVQKKVGGKSPQFLDQIEVTPGTPASTNHQTSSFIPKQPITRRNNESYTPSGETASSLNLERANWLQLKYAVVIDAPVENLTNIPLLENIEKWWGTRYCMGGVTDNCLDCSAFTQILLRDVYTIPLPRTAQEQYDKSQKIDLEDLREGDLVFFHTSGREISHVGVYLQNNKFVHASTSGGVMISDLNEKYWQPRFRGGRRMGRDSK